MPTIVAKADNLDELNRNYAQTPLKCPVFLNSVPKCGTHLLRNIVRMFVPVEQQYHKTYVQHAVLGQHMAAFNPATPMLSWGHLFFSDAAAIVLHETRKVLLVRDPYDWVLARARFFLSDTFQGSIEHLKGGRVTADEVLNMMIFGVHEKMPTLQEIFLHNAVAWLGTDVALLRYEELVNGLANARHAGGRSLFHFRAFQLRHRSLAGRLAGAHSRGIRSRTKRDGPRESARSSGRDSRRAARYAKKTGRFCSPGTQADSRLWLRRSIAGNAARHSPK